MSPACIRACGADAGSSQRNKGPEVSTSVKHERSSWVFDRESSGDLEFQSIDTNGNSEHIGQVGHLMTVIPGTGHSPFAHGEQNGYPCSIQGIPHDLIALAHRHLHSCHSQNP